VQQAGEQCRQQSKHRRTQRGSHAIAKQSPDAEAPKPLADQAEGDKQQQGGTGRSQRPVDCRAAGNQQNRAKRQPAATPQPAGGIRIGFAECRRQQDRQRAQGSQANEAQGVEVQVEQPQAVPMFGQQRYQQDGQQGQQ
jgi:hypothetical protein